MDPNEPLDDRIADAFDQAVREDVDLASPVSRERAQRFYDRMRASIHAYLDRKGPVAGKSAEYLLLVPDVFMLLFRLLNDARVNAKEKVLLGSGIAYYLFPLDIIPEGFIGPTGYVDDLVFAVILLNRMIATIDPAVLREHWSGREDILETIRKVLGAAESLVGAQILGRFRKNK